MDAPHGIIWWVILGIFAGFLTGKIMKGSGYGVLADLLLGIGGAVVGGWIFHALGLPTTSLVGGLIAAVLGAVIVVTLFRTLARRRSVF